MAGELGVRVAIAGIRGLPVRALSRLAGRVARQRLPRPVLRLMIRGFGRAVGVDFGEMRDPVESFETFQDFFVRRLRDGARPVDAGADAFVAPCDGAWGASGRIEGGSLLQLKGRPYSLAQLLGDDEAARRLEGGCFATFYLSPRDYHRFHAPCDVEVVAASHQPGTLWPVNSIGLRGVDGLFAENERICAWMRLAGATGAPPLCLVAVGATMVGCVKVEFDDLVTNRGAERPTHRQYTSPRRFTKGEEWGRFEFGSTLVLVAAPGSLELQMPAPGTALRQGERIGSTRSV